MLGFFAYAGDSPRTGWRFLWVMGHHAEGDIDP